MIQVIISFILDFFKNNGAIKHEGEVGKKGCLGTALFLPTTGLEITSQTTTGGVRDRTRLEADE